MSKLELRHSRVTIVISPLALQVAKWDNDVGHAAKRKRAQSTVSLSDY